ncbi:MAG: GNAT family N-acetyltransferase [Halieaceae bacterium]
MREYVEQTFGPWVAEEQRSIIEKSFDPATHQLILVQGNAVGLLATRFHEDYVQLEKLYLLPEFQRLGIGSKILKELTSSACSSGIPIHLRVLSSNLGALKLYDRLGFVVVDEAPERKFMEYHA